LRIRKHIFSAFFVLLLAACVLPSANAQTPAAAPASAPKPVDPKPAIRTKQIHLKHVLVIGETKGFEHDSVSAAMNFVYNAGKESGLWDTEMRTDTELLTKKDIGRNAKNLNYFDCIVFASTTGELDMDDSQKADMMSFIKDDGKCFVGIHAALDTNYKWPEYGEMTGGWFDQHPWSTFQAPIINEDQNFPATRHFPAAFTKYDEIYQPKNFDRAKAHVLLSLDPSKLDYGEPYTSRIHRMDHDFPVAWDKMYGKGRVFYSTLGHTEEAWDDPDIKKMYFEAIRWALGMTEGDTTTHPRPAASAAASR
jgi:type 1 glutamine amidotransferase